MKEPAPQTTVSLILDFFNAGVLAGAQAYAASEGIRLDARWSVRGDWSPNHPLSDGVIHGIVDNDALEERIAGWEIPKVSLVEREGGNPQILPDYKASGIMAAKEVISDGAPRLLNIISSRNALDQTFAAGVSSFAARSGTECRVIESYLEDFEQKAEWIVSEIQASRLPAGVCMPHAGLAYTLQELFGRKGIRVPEDVMMIVIEKDVQNTTTLAPVPLTSIELDEWHRGYLATEMVNRLIRKESLPQKRVLLPPKGIMRRASTGHPDIKDQVVAKVLKYLRQNHLERIGVAEVASQVGFSRRVIEKRFREVLNRGVHEELTRLRIQEAKRRITRAEESMTSIAEACGFSSIHYFSTAFKKATGVSPKAYQKQGISDGDSAKS